MRPSIPHLTSLIPSCFGTKTSIFYVTPMREMVWNKHANILCDEGEDNKKNEPIKLPHLSSLTQTYARYSNSNPPDRMNIILTDYV